MNTATSPILVLLAAGLSLLLAGCGAGAGGGPTPIPPTPIPAPSPGGPTTAPSGTTAPPRKNTNIWQWRTDMDMGHQITYDLSDDIQEHGIYGGCWRTPGVQTLAGAAGVQYGPVDKQFHENGKIYGTYDGETGVTLFNLRNDTHTPGCLMRKSREPVDLSKLSRIEMDVKSSGGKDRKAPWYAVWLAPMVYADRDDNAKAAEIDMIENYDWLRRGQDMNLVQSNFAQCGNIGYTQPYCQGSSWGRVATELHHHVTISAKEVPGEGRVIRVYRCKNPSGETLETCTDGPYSQIYVTKPGPSTVPKDKWFKIWNHEVAGEKYGHYFMVIDMWWTSNNDFQVSADNIKFFNNDGSEWTMPLDDPPPPTPAPNMPSMDEKPRSDVVV